MGFLRLLLLVIVDLPVIKSTVTGVCNCSIDYYQVLCGSLLQPSENQLFANFDSLHEVNLTSEYTPFVFSMSSCSMGSISGTPFIQFSNLIRAQISGNSINKVDSGVFSNLKDLELLNLQDNFISELHPDVFRGLDNLQTLDLSENNLASLANTVFVSNPKLNKLVLKKNQLRSIGDSVFKGNQNLSELDLSDNNLQSLPTKLFSGVQNLMALNLAGNQLEHFPKCVSTQTGLVHLDMSSNGLSEVPETSFSGMKKLRVVDLSKNELSAIGDRIFSASENLEVLHLHQNRLKIFPKNSLKGLKYIRKLDLSNNSIQNLPPFILADLRIDTLDLSYNEIRAIDSTAFKDLLPESSLSLDLSANSIEYLTVVMFEDLVSLLSNFRVDLSNNQIRCNCAMSRFYEWITQQLPDLKGFSTITCAHPVGVRDIRLTELKSKHSLVCAAPQIEHAPSRFYAREGHLVFLPCFNTAEPRAQITWYFQSTEIRNSSQVQISPFGSLIINSASESDSGPWTCKAANTRGEDSITFELLVSACKFEPNLLLYAAIVLFLTSLILFSITTLLWIYGKVWKSDPDKDVKDAELNHRKSPHVAQAPPALPKQADFRVPDFLKNGKSFDNIPNHCGQPNAG